MSTHKSVACRLTTVIALGWLTTAGAQTGPGLGVRAANKLITAWDISIPPDGAGLPPGAGTALEGEGIYAARCLACHGPNGAGQPNDQLAGGLGTLDSATPVKTIGSYWPYATTVFDYIRRAMPLPQPQSLTDDETYALTAYVLSLNGIIKPDKVMNAKTLPKVVMPNRDGIFWAYGKPPG
jgi:mono/diheme cytochrome c family protein